MTTADVKRQLDSIETAHKLAMAQLQFAQQVLHGLQKQLAEVPATDLDSAKSEGQP